MAFPISANVDAEISHNVMLYISLYAFVLPFSFLESIYNAIKNATGKPEATFFRMLIMLMLKIIFNQKYEKIKYQLSYLKKILRRGFISKKLMLSITREFKPIQA